MLCHGELHDEPAGSLNIMKTDNATAGLAPADGSAKPYTAAVNFILGDGRKRKHAKPDWLEIGAAYDEAAEHLEVCASESDDPTEKEALRIVAGRIRRAASRLKPNTQASHERSSLG